LQWHGMHVRTHTHTREKRDGPVSSDIKRRDAAVCVIWESPDLLRSNKKTAVVHA
jgi:hypothetical protein